MTASQEHLKVVLSAMQDVLKPLGYRKHGKTFEKRTDDVSLLIQVQSSVSSTKDSLILTVNLAVFSWVIAKMRKPWGETASVWESHWRERIGFYREKPSDYWWTIQDEADARRAGDDIVSILKSKGLKELERVDSTEKLRLMWERGRCSGLMDSERLRFLAILNGETS